MDRDEFLKYLELYGGDLGRWPSGLGEEAGPRARDPVR